MQIYNNYSKNACLVGMIGFPLGYIFDIFLYPDYSAQLLGIRIGICFILSCLFFLLSKTEGKKHTFLYSTAFAVSMLSISLMCIVVKEGFSSPYFAGNLLVILTAAILLDLPVKEYLTTLGIMDLLHFGLISIFCDFSFNGFLYNLYFIGLGSIICIILHSHTYNIRKANKYLVNIHLHDIKNRLILLPLFLHNDNSHNSIILKSELDRIKAYVTNIMNISEFENEGIRLKISNVKHSTIFDYINNYNTICSVKGIQLNPIKKTTLSEILLDWRYISLAIDNLIQNAISYISDDNPVIAVTITDTSISVGSSGTEISKDDQMKFFNKFENKTLRTPYSKGLGLQFCKMIMILHGGTIEYKYRNNMNEFILNFKKHKY